MMASRPLPDPTAGLDEVVRRLDVPHPERARLLREMRADLEDLTGALRARGLAGDEARRRAEGMLLPGPPALDALERIHRPLYRRLTDRFEPRRMRVWERGALVTLSVFALTSALAALAGAELLTSPSAFLLPVLTLGTGAVAAALAKAFQLFVKRNHAAGSLRPGLGWVLGAAAVTLVVGVLGFLIDLYGLAARMAAGPADPGRAVLEFVRRGATLLVSSTVLALLAGLLWFLLLQWIARVEDAEAELRLRSQQREVPS